MKARLALIAAALLCLTAVQHAKAAEDWTSPDKFAHFDMGRISAIYATQHFSKRNAFLIGTGIGLAKELGDSTGAVPSVADFTVTAIGALAGAYAPGLSVSKRRETISVSYTWSF
jgi:opacity protein-like surface antigen